MVNKSIACLLVAQPEPPKDAGEPIHEEHACRTPDPTRGGVSKRAGSTLIDVVPKLKSFARKRNKEEPGMAALLERAKDAVQGMQGAVSTQHKDIKSNITVRRPCPMLRRERAVACLVQARCWQLTSECLNSWCLPARLSHAARFHSRRDLHIAFRECSSNRRKGRTGSRRTPSSPACIQSGAGCR